jgi:hypothetical protein
VWSSACASNELYQVGNLVFFWARAWLTATTPGRVIGRAMGREAIKQKPQVRRQVLGHVDRLPTKRRVLTGFAVVLLDLACLTTVL